MTQRAKEIQLRDLEEQLNALDNDSRNLTADIIAERGSVERGRLQRQQTSLFSEMNNLEQQIDRLMDEIWQERSTPELIDLYGILSNIHKNFIDDAYKSVPGLSHRQAPSALKYLMLQINDLPKEEEQPLKQFVNALINSRSLNAIEQQRLQDWAIDQQITIAPRELMPDVESDSLKTCLMIKVKAHPPDKYQVEAAIVRNMYLWRIEDVLQDSTHIDVPSKFNSGCIKEELPEFLCELITFCSDKHSIALSDLTVQWFLPIGLMSLDVEMWQIPAGNPRPCNGERCQSVMIRCVDRMDRNLFGAVLGEWKRNWKKVSRTSHCHNVLDYINTMATRPQVGVSGAAVVGYRFLEHSDHQQREIFWNNLIGRGLPLAVWSRSRSNVTLPTRRKWLNSVSKCSLDALPASVSQFRQKTLSQTPIPNHAHISVLWDNPFLPFPSIELFPPIK